MKFLLFATFSLTACLITAFPAWGASGTFDQSTVMVENARLSDAEEMLQQWLASHPEDQEARFLLARVLAWQQKHAEALAQYELLLKNEPDNIDYHTGKRMLSIPAHPESSGIKENPLGISLQR